MLSRYPLARYFIIVFSVLALNAKAAPEPDYAAIQSAYTERDGAAYQTSLSEAINFIRRLTPDSCVQQQQGLLDTARMLAFDGLEPLWLLLQDCTARAVSAAVQSQALENASRFVQWVRFDVAPAPNMTMYIARHNGLVVRSVRGDAVRIIVEQARQLSPQDLAQQGLDDLLGRSTSQHALCQLEIRRNQYGQAALPDLIVHALCAHAGVSGGFGTVDEMCRQLLNEQSTSPNISLIQVSAEPLTDQLLQTPGVDAADIDRLSDFCNSRFGGSGFAGGGMDALDGHSEDACFGGRAEQIAEVGRLAQLIEDCLLSSSNDNPLADGGGDQNTNNDSKTVKNDDGTTTTTTKNPDGSTTETTTYPNGHSVSTTTHTDGATTTEVNYPDGSSERVTMGADGKIESAQTVTVAPDGTQTVKEYDGEGNLIRSEEIHHLGDVDDVVVTEDGRTYQAIVPAGWIDEAMDRIEKQKLNDQGKGAYIINIWAKPEGAESPGSDLPGAGFDASNPACFELANMGFIDGEGGVLSSDDLWDYLFGREPGEPHPSTVYPTPDTIDDVNQEQLCGEFSIGSVSGSHCRLPVLCTEGTELDENCQCKPIMGDSAGSLVGNGCATYHCADGTTPVPIGLNGCTCHDPETEGGEPGPRPGPSPDPFAELMVHTDAALAKPGISASSPLVNGEPGNPVHFTDDRLGQ